MWCAVVELCLLGTAVAVNAGKQNYGKFEDMFLAPILGALCSSLPHFFGIVYVFQDEIYKA